MLRKFADVLDQHVDELAFLATLVRCLILSCAFLLFSASNRKTARL